MCTKMSNGLSLDNISERSAKALNDSLIFNAELLLSILTFVWKDVDSLANISSTELLILMRISFDCRTSGRILDVLMVSA